ncbi:MULTISPECIES: response regulator [Methanobacterium]|jgi:two-component SAPR family response regulator|uniref:Response regulator n=1 Tax=Methanobacterium subterraneum TaxID=59277 RepID=A0A2H4VCN9_9EURY|nr:MULTISPECIES: response regulator [Methanobacterium]PKL73517.1 MAG: response regulator [Methanobacteriales archaeon HGW-Methanobacteriales-2]AUB55857.1 response regulator [Methanobacterium subterraneum]AUB57134.1 response regulator [Methanobacterium sp. MZ-A1]NMO08510.1 response regulator [Methanobacterium subterraneum]HII83427.1 response regulator [Methanobacterium subterraneum]
MNILLVENDINTLRNLNTILENLDHHVVGTVSSGVDAISKARNLKVDLILISLELKGELSGVETAKQILSSYNIPVIFLTVFIKNCLNKSLQLPDDAIVVSKPIKRDHLEYAIVRALKMRINL